MTQYSAPQHQHQAKARIQITDLRLRTIIGTNDWEREVKQDIVINVTIDFDAAKASESDNIKDTVNYKKITKKIIKLVEKSQFNLLEKLTVQVLNIVMADPKVIAASLRIDKPHALRFANSVSIEMEKSRDAGFGNR